MFWILFTANMLCAIWLWPTWVAGLNLFAAGWLLGNYAPCPLEDEAPSAVTESKVPLSVLEKKAREAWKE